MRVEASNSAPSGRAEAPSPCPPELVEGPGGRGFSLGHDDLIRRRYRREGLAGCAAIHRTYYNDPSTQQTVLRTIKQPNHTPRSGE